MGLKELVKDERFPKRCLCIMGTLSDGSPFVSRDLAGEYNTEQQLWRTARMRVLGANVQLSVQTLNMETLLWETADTIPDEAMRPMEAAIAALAKGATA